MADVRMIIQNEVDQRLRALQDTMLINLRALDDELDRADEEEDRAEVKRLRGDIAAFRERVEAEILMRRRCLAMPWSSSRPS